MIGTHLIAERFLSRLAMAAGLAVAACAAGAPEPAGPVATLADGTHLTGAAQVDGIDAFLGIRYGKAPVGPARFRAPEAVTYAPGAVVAATALPPACPQDQGNPNWYRRVAAAFGKTPDIIPPLAAISEDCLFLNVWAPRQHAGDLPVMVWIHGGSNINGWSAEPNYLGASLAGKGVVLVSLQYRLGNLGFLPLPFVDAADPSGQYGLQDLLLALQWVRENITGFGGNAGNVTLMGESAGGGNIAALMHSPAAVGLFRRAIIESGALGPQATTDLQSALDAARQIYAAKGIRSAAAAGAAPWRDLIGLEGVDYYHYPVADGRLVDASPDALKATDLLIGTNRDEMLMYLPADTDAAVASGLEYFARPTAAQAYVAARSPDRREQANRLETAANFQCPALKLAARNSAAGGTSFVYEFTRVRMHGAALGAYHGAEIPYVFDTHDGWLPTGETDRTLTDTIMAYWVNFAKTGNPNGSGLPTWQAYGPTAGYLQELGTQVGQATDVPTPLCQFLDKD
ncbi:MAG: hypothetical protein EP335_17255 [Alphaproteobacteria bacterium]|nr:MAG: hypothetical protein EP335_17255 [Alphaproteobacteria bacterium]